MAQPKSTDCNSAQSTNLEAASIVNGLPAALQKRLESSHQDLLKSCKETSGWDLEAQHEGITVSSQPVDGKYYKKWKVEFTVIRRSVDEIFKQMYDISERTKWDGAILSGEQVYEHVEHIPPDLTKKFFISKVVTQPQAGGSVSSREIVSGSLKLETAEFPLVVSQIDFSDKDLLKELVEILDEDMKLKLEQIVEQNRNLVRAELASGVGFALEDLSDEEYKCTLINAVDLKGWLLPPVINAATASVMKESAEMFKKRVAALST